MIDVRAHLARKPLLFDGGMGTYYKAKPGTECEQGNLLDPAGVRKVHREYLAAGAEAIKTNTFGLPRMAAARQPDWQALARAGWKLWRRERPFFGPGPGSGYRGCPGGKHLHGSGPLFCGAGGKELPV